MNIAQAKQQVTDAVEAYFTYDENGMPFIDPAKQRPLFLIGAPGIGKTAIMSQIADEMGIGLISYSMTHHTRQSALGLPFIVHHNFEGFEYDASEYTMSEIIASIYDYMEATGKRKGILFLDEINCVSETLYPSMLQFLQFKSFGRHCVPENWAIVCAGNPPEYNKSVHEFDVVTLDRLRKITIEPDYDAWRAYALENNIHPAILSYLEVKKENFYHVESTPEGKTFVTARGWEDLSQLMRLFEQNNKTVNRIVIEQFIQNAEIAESFSLHYDLFNKYKSDYQVSEILSGEVTDVIKERAAAAAFDERLALLGMMMDLMTSRASTVLRQEEAITQAREALREMKEQLISGATVEDTLGAALTEINTRLNSKTSAPSLREKQQMGIVRAMYQECQSRCVQAGITAGEKVFTCIQEVYGEQLAKMEEAIVELQGNLDNSFAFTDNVLDPNREGLVLATEITARKPLASFITKFGSDSYHEHNQNLQLQNRQSALQDKIAQLGLQNTPTLRVQ